MDSARGVVFVRAGEAEIGQHPIAHELRDEAVVARDCAGARVLIGPDDFPHVLGIEPRRHRGRTDEIAEHDGELAALGGVGRARGNRIRRRRGRGLHNRGGGWGGEFLDRRQYRATMSDGGDAKLFEVFDRQLRQYLSVDFIVAKSGLVLRQAKAS